MGRMLNWMQARRRQEDGSGLVLAILLIIVMLSLVAILTATVMSSISKSAQTRDITFHSLAADAALNDALRIANSEVFDDGSTAIQNYLGEENARTGTLSPSSGSGSDIHWQWYARETPTSAYGTDYYIYATGYRLEVEEEGAYNLRARLSSFPYEGSRDEDGTSVYLLPPAGLHNLGTVGLRGVTTSENASFFTYNSAAGDIGAGDASTPRSEITVAEEGELLMTDYSGFVSHANIYNFQDEDSLPERCGGDDCQVNTTTYPYDIDSSWVFSASNVEKMVGQSGTAADVCENDFPNWTSSADGTVLQPDDSSANFLCVNNLNIDQDTTIAPRFTSGNPLYLFVTGNLEVSPNASFNNNKTPLSLRTFVNGNVTVHGASIPSTKVSTALVSTDSGTCTIGSPGGFTDFKGAIACDELNVLGNTNIWHDSQTSQLRSQNYHLAWALSEYEIR